MVTPARGPILLGSDGLIHRFGLGPGLVASDVDERLQFRFGRCNAFERLLAVLLGCCGAVAEGIGPSADGHSEEQLMALDAIKAPVLISLEDAQR